MCIELEFRWRTWSEKARAKGAPPPALDDCLAGFPELRAPAVIERLRSEESYLRRRFGGVGMRIGRYALLEEIGSGTFARVFKDLIPGYTPGGLTAIPAPEPASGLSIPVGLAALARTARRLKRR